MSQLLVTLCTGNNLIIKPLMNSDQFERLKKAFSPVSFTDEVNTFFLECWQEKQFDRSDLITEAGNIERYLYFVLEGIQAIYVINPKGQKVVLGFSYAGDLSGVYDSFLTRQPSSYFLEALSPSKLLAISPDNFAALYERFPPFEKWGRLFHQNILIGRIDREIELLTLSAKERYIKFMRRCPEPLLQIPQKYLASYLNMKPETFSRLRGRVRY